MAAKRMPLGFMLEIKEALVKAAKSQHRAVSNLTELNLKDWLEDEGFLPRSNTG